MLEARLDQAEILKKVLDAVKELVTDANFDCSDEGIQLQAMDNSHVALVSLNLTSSGFSEYRCDRNMSLGMSLPSLQKIIKCAGNDDVITLRADESHDVLGLLFENKKHDRVGEYEMKLMDIDQEHLGIPDTVYDAEVILPASEFTRIIRDLKELGESVKIEVSKDGVRFSSEGDIGSASVTLKQTSKGGKGGDSDDEDEDDEEEKNDEEEEEEEEEKEDEDVKDEDDVVDVKPEVKPTAASDDDEAPKPTKSQANGDDEEEDKPEAEMVIDDDDDEEEEDDEAKADKLKMKKEKAKKEKAKKEKENKKRKSSTAPKGKGKVAKKPKAEKKEATDVTINLQQAVALTFSIKYLSNFTKSGPLSDYVQLHMSSEVPLLVQYSFAQGSIRYYLAPKIADE